MRATLAGSLGRGLINRQSNAAAGGRRMSAIGGIADIRGFWLAMVCPLMTQLRHQPASHVAVAKRVPAPCQSTRLSRYDAVS